MFYKVSSPQEILLVFINIMTRRHRRIIFHSKAIIRISDCELASGAKLPGFKPTLPLTSCVTSDKIFKLSGTVPSTLK